MPTTGFLTNTGTASGITTSYDVTKGLALTDTDTTAGEPGITSVPGSETPLPQGVYLDHLTIRATNTGAVATIYCWLSWDAAGDNIITAEGTLAPVTMLTTTTLIGGAIPIDAWVRPPGKQLTIYLWMKTNANSIAVAENGIRLDWTNSFDRVG